MKLTLFIVCVMLVSVLVHSSPLPQQEVQVVEYENNNDGTGNYNFKFSLSDGTKQDETGSLKDVQTDDGPVQAVVKTGSYEFTDLDGKVHRVSYTADENGFHPVVES